MKWVSEHLIKSVRDDACQPLQFVSQDKIKTHLSRKSIISLGQWWSCSFLAALSVSLFSWFFFFRGPGREDTEQIDISYYSILDYTKELLLAFRQSGFANASNESEYKLLPCSLGTFVKASSKDPKCLECPAGNFSLIYDMRVTHRNRKDKHVHSEISVMYLRTVIYCKEFLCSLK